MNLRTLPALLAICALILTAPNAEAQTLDKNRAGITKLSEKVSIEIYGGYLRGQSRELVYDPTTGHKNSELIWTIDGAYVVGGTLAVRPVDWLTFKLSGWTPIKTRNSMDDYDWEYESRNDWSDWSNHPDTKMNRAHMINASLAARVAKFDKTSWFDNAQLDLLAGYRWFYISWTAYGGTYIYSTKPSGWRDDIGADPEGSLGIAYEQWIQTPYVGIGGSMNIKRWSFAGELTGSLWSRASDRDNHYNRTLLFEEEFNNMPMIAGEVSVGYALTNSLSLCGSFVYQKYYEVQSSSTETNYSTGVVRHASGDAAGMDHYSMLFNLGLKWVVF